MSHLFKKGNKIGSETRFQKGHKINTGRERTEEHNKKLALARMGEKHPLWKGDEVSYRSLHEWVRKYLPIPKACTKCEQEKPLDLANITGLYNRDFNNWQYLCRSCHIKLDRGL